MCTLRAAYNIPMSIYRCDVPQRSLSVSQAFKMLRTKRVINAFPYMASPRHLSAVADEPFPPPERRSRREDVAKIETLSLICKIFWCFLAITLHWESISRQPWQIGTWCSRHPHAPKGREKEWKKAMRSVAYSMHGCLFITCEQLFISYG